MRLIFVDSCFSDTCLGKEEVRVCALDGLWPKPVRTDPFPSGGLLYSMHIRWQLPFFTINKASLFYWLWMISNPLGTKFSGLSWQCNIFSHSCTKDQGVGRAERLDYSPALDMILPPGPMVEVSKKKLLHFVACQFDPDSPLLLWSCPSEINFVFLSRCWDRVSKHYSSNSSWLPSLLRTDLSRC